MIQFNLLPDVKLEYIRARRLKRTVQLLSITVASSAVVILVMLFLLVSVFQKKHLNDLSKDIEASSKKLQGTSDINKILTIQNQLNTLSTLYKTAPVTSRLFSFVQQITPNAASISELDLDYGNQTITVKGSADTIETINKYADTIKFTTYKTADGSQKSAFSSVVLTSFSRTNTSSDYQIDMKFDPAIFDAANNITALTVPSNFITTRSQIDKPNDLFQSSSTGH